MVENSVELIHRILSGDDEAFRLLVQKHQKRVHALIWRKIGDFHIAEEITQDTFLKVYKKLATLKDPNLFDGWLYVIANRLCMNWIRRNRPKVQLQSLEDTQVDAIEKTSYANYESERREAVNAERRRELVKKLLEKLPESERTVMTLYYLGEMTAKEIGKFLGVSVNTIKSRLRRARGRLQSEEELLVNEVLRGLQLSPSLLENVMQQVVDMKPDPVPVGKPLLPWAAFGTAAALVILLLGVGSQYLARFQKPYNINAQSETTVEIIDTRIVLDTPAKPDLRNQAGRFETTGRHSGTGSQASKPIVLAAAQIKKEPRLSTEQQWVQASGLESGTMSGLLLSSKDDVYAASSTGIYRLAPDTSGWTLVNASMAISGSTPMAERDGKLYLVSAREVHTSTDRGENWESLGARPNGDAVGLVITDDGLYLALNKQIFRSIDAGKQWTPLGSEETDRINFVIANLENTVFVGTNRGLYRLDSSDWEKLPVDTTKAIHSLAVSEKNIYVGTGPDFTQLTTPEGRAAHLATTMADDGSISWEIFHSADLGDSWTEITPASDSPFLKISPGIKVVASGETLLALGVMTNFSSTDGGKTWTEFDFEFDIDTFDMNTFLNSAMTSMFPAVAVDERTFIKAGMFGLTRSTDGGTSWHGFMKGIVGTTLFNLVGFKNALYTSTATGVAKSTDGGESWETLRVDTSELTLQRVDKIVVSKMLVFPKLLTFNDVLYSITPDLIERNRWRVLRLSADENVLVPIQGFPAFPEGTTPETQETKSEIALKQDITDDNSANDPEKTDIARHKGAESSLAVLSNGFAVSGDTFYMEYQQRLFRWTRGDPEWTDTGLIDATQPSDNPFDSRFKIAVSAETVYVSKRDGHLLRSLDGGNTWKDLTPNLPLRFKRVNEMVFVDSTVYIATDTGVLTSVDGEQWRSITDTEGAHVAINRIAMADTAIYGAGAKGVYKLNNKNRWEQVSPAVPDTVLALVASGNRLYIATLQRGMFYISLENENEK